MAKGYIRLFDRHLVDVFNVQVEDIHPVNHIHSLSCINRYTGHMPYPISVGQHSTVLTKYMMRHANLQHLAQCAYIHDWSEAFFNDLASPVKKNMRLYQKYEMAAQEVIFEAMNVDIQLLDELHYYDKQIYIDESNAGWGDVARQGVLGEDRIGLGVASMFREKTWRDVRDEYMSLGRIIFPGRID